MVITNGIIANVFGHNKLIIIIIIIIIIIMIIIMIILINRR